MATTHPDLAKELVGTDPTTVVAGTGKVLEWRCAIHKGTYKKRGADRVNGVGCGICNGKKVLPGFNDMATTHPDLAKELVGTDPRTVIAGTNKTLIWQCKNHPHTFPSAGASRLAGNGCGVCANRILLTGFNDMATTHPKLAKELVGADPKKIMAGTTQVLQWKCSVCQRRWPARGAKRVAGSGCSKCNKYGHDQAAPSFFYLVTRSPGQVKFGIMNVWTKRIEQHFSKGWSLLDRVGMTGQKARSLETTVKQTLRAKGVPTGIKAFRKKFPGGTEAFREVDLYVRSIRGLCRKLGIDLDAFLAA
jgi:hypothetical protein